MCLWKHAFKMYSESCYWSKLMFLYIDQHRVFDFVIINKVDAIMFFFSSEVFFGCEQWWSKCGKSTSIWYQQGLEDRQADNKLLLNWLDIVHPYLPISGHEASSRLAGYVPQWTVAPRDYYHIIPMKCLF